MNDFSRGFRAVLPLWLAALPVGLAYTAAAHDAGLSAIQVQVMSITVYSAAAQMAMVQLWSAGAPGWTLLLTVAAMNIHNLLYGLSLRRQMPLSRAQRALAASLLTDAAYGVTAAAGERASFGFLLGAEASMFAAWNGSVALGLAFGPLLHLPPGLRLDFVVPLTFGVLLAASLKTRLDWLVAAVSAGLALACAALGLGSISIVVVGLGGALAGAWLACRPQFAKQEIRG
jgi:predicted branched-subunit amino acid permease